MLGLFVALRSCAVTTVEGGLMFAMVMLSAAIAAGNPNHGHSVARCSRRSTRSSLTGGSMSTIVVYSDCGIKWALSFSFAVTWRVEYELQMVHDKAIQWIRRWLLQVLVFPCSADPVPVLELAHDTRAGVAHNGKHYER